MSKPERSTKAHAEVSRLKPDDRLLTPPTNFFSKPYLGETEEGGEWLRLPVFGVIYCFGIKGGIGADSLSAFFHLLRLQERIGCSASALRELGVKIKEKMALLNQDMNTNCASDTKVSLGLGFKNPRQEDSYLKSATP
ncbi:hypothetical protein PN432_03735 [Microcystis aeruginosa CS-579]|nr:hypothetical protein [Microcystis aeruginosa CS-579]